MTQTEDRTWPRAKESFHSLQSGSIMKVTHEKERIDGVEDGREDIS